jgi:hypothetical protein
MGQWQPPPPPPGIPMPEYKKDEGSPPVKDVDAIIASTLSPQHATDPNVIKFIYHFAHCRDEKQAARLTGLNARDGRNLIERADIYNCVQQIAGLSARRFGYDAEEIVERVKEVVRADMAEAQDDKGRFEPILKKWPDELRRAVRKMKVKNVYAKDPNGMIDFVEAEIIEVEFWDKLKAAEMLGTEKDTFKKKSVVTHEISGNMKDVLLAAGKRAEQRLLAPPTVRDVEPVPPPAPDLDHE